jgi:hypothetical protein
MDSAEQYVYRSLPNPALFIMLKTAITANQNRFQSSKQFPSEKSLQVHHLEGHVLEAGSISKTSCKT